MVHPDQIRQKRIAYACFDWGFGHVTRSVSIIRELIQQENSIVFFGNEKQVAFMQAYFPEVNYIIWEVPELEFSGSSNFVQEAFRQWKKILKIQQLEKQFLTAENNTRSFDLILSDHRYSFRIARISSVFITHQFQLPKGTPFLVQLIHHLWMNKFTDYWILDEKPGFLAGDLTRNVKQEWCIGLQSRFKLESCQEEGKGILIVLSGPEVYARQFLETLNSARNLSGIQVLANFPKPTTIHADVNWFEQGKIPFQKADQLFLDTEWIVSRTGYSTLMDLCFLKKKALLLATPGQLEQEYLAKKCTLSNVNACTDEREFLEKFTALLQRYST